MWRNVCFGGIYMGNVLKSSRYRMISNRSFELPLPLKYELYREDEPVAEYEISADENVSCRIITRFKEEMLTPVHRSIGIADIYYFLSTRVFQDNTPFTYSELALLGLEKYSVYDILRKTRGITPFDRYWLKFSGDSCGGYDEALKTFNELMTPKNGVMPMMYMPYMPMPNANVVQNTAPAPVQQAPAPVQQTATSAPVMEEPEPQESSGGMMSQDEIEKLLAAATAQDTVSEPEPSEFSGGGTLSQDEIERMLAQANSTPEPETPSSSGGMMSQDEIEKMIAQANSATAETAPQAETTPTAETSASGGKMSQDEIEKMIAAANAATPEPVPQAEPAPTAETSASGGMMSQDEIEKMIAAANSANAETAPQAETTPLVL